MDEQLDIYILNIINKKWNVWMDTRYV